MTGERVNNVKAAIAALAAGAVVGAGGVAAVDVASQPEVKPAAPASPAPTTKEPVVKPKVTADKVLLIEKPGLTLDNAKPYVKNLLDTYGYASDFSAGGSAITEGLVTDAEKNGRVVHEVAKADDIAPLVRRAALGELGNLELVTADATVKRILEPVLEGRDFRSGKLAVIITGDDLLAVVHQSQKQNLVDGHLDRYAVAHTLRKIAGVKSPSPKVEKASDVAEEFGLPLDGCA